jgi:thiamine-phosphate pyrophosphorylase
LDETETPQLYLTTPPAIGGGFADRLAAALDAASVACVRLDIATRDPEALGRAADALREVAHARDVPLVIAEHIGLVERHGLDGVHLIDGARGVRSARKALGGDRIVGSFSRTSRHDGMTAGEAGADYVAFGPVRDTGLGDGTVAGRELFAWWSEMIEVPVVAEGVDAATAAELAPVVDFVVPDVAVWEAGDVAAALREIARVIA